MDSVEVAKLEANKYASAGQIVAFESCYVYKTPLDNSAHIRKSELRSLKSGKQSLLGSYDFNYILEKSWKIKIAKE